jgi:hypothetical protein
MLIMEASSPQLILAMPLHAITEVYGEDGLRQRFLLEVQQFPDSDQFRLEEALELASQLHRDDRRSREPYMNHLLRTAVRILCYYEVTDVDVVVAAVLHDAVEDHPDELAAGADGDAVAAALQVLSDRFGTRVAELIQAVTNPPREPGRDRFEQYREHVAESLEANPWARVIKVSDFTDNGVGLIHSAPSTHTRLATKYRPLIPVFRELIARPDTPLAQHVKEHIYRQLDSAQTRLDAMVGVHDGR